MNVGYLHECLRFELQIGKKFVILQPFIDPQFNLKTILKP